MKMIKFPFLILVMAFAIMSAFAFNTKPVKALHSPVTYYYTGDNTLAHVRTAALWVASGDPCFATGGTPCSLTYPSSSRSAFDAHVAAFPSVAQANSECDTKRD
jgi:hypothetical protein